MKLANTAFGTILGTQTIMKLNISFMLEKSLQHFNRNKPGVICKAGGDVLKLRPASECKYFNFHLCIQQWCGLLQRISSVFYTTITFMTVFVFLFI